VPSVDLPTSVAPRTRATLFAAALALAACGAAEQAEPAPAPTTVDPESDEPAEEEPVEDDPPERAEPPADARLAARLVLEHPTIEANGSTSRDEGARLDATLFVSGAPGTVVTMVLPVASELEWTLTAEDGTTWEPVFLPPPMPRPGGPPRTTVTIAASGEAEVGVVHGISGFRRPGATDWQEGLPRGTYEVRVTGFDLGDGVSRAAPPMTLTAR